MGIHQARRHGRSQRHYWRMRPGAVRACRDYPRSRTAPHCAQGSAPVRSWRRGRRRFSLMLQGSKLAIQSLAASPPPRSAESWGMPRPQKITFGEMRSTGVHSVLIYCADCKCSHGRESSRDYFASLEPPSSTFPPFLTHLYNQKIKGSGSDGPFDCRTHKVPRRRHSWPFLRRMIFFVAGRGSGDPALRVPSAKRSAIR